MKRGRKEKKTDLVSVMCGLWVVPPYAEVEGGLVGTCLSTGNACRADAGGDLCRDGDGGHVLVVADRGGLGVRVGMVWGVRCRVRVVCSAGKDLFGRGVLLEPGRV